MAAAKVDQKIKPSSSYAKDEEEKEEGLAYSSRHQKLHFHIFFGLFSPRHAHDSGGSNFDELLKRLHSNPTHDLSRLPPFFEKEGIDLVRGEENQ